MSVEKKQSRWSKVRKFFNDLHLWMGLASGLIVIVVCFSGTVYVFNTELKEWAAPELYTLKEAPQTPVLTAEEIITHVEASVGGKVQSLKISADPLRTWSVSVKKPSTAEKQQSQPRGSRPNTGTQYAVNPYTGEVIGDVTNHKNGVTEFMRLMFSLHRWLLLDRVEEPIIGDLENRKLGSYITGTATILFTLGVMTGLIIWFPQKIKSWKQGLKIRWDAKWKRVNHDLHNVLGFYSLIFLFLMGITGPQWSFPWYREGLQKSLGTYRAPDAPAQLAPQSKGPGETVTTKTPVAAYLATADRLLPYRGDYSIVFPQDSLAAVSISKTRTGFFASPASDKLLVDQYTADPLQVDIFADKPLNERVAGSIKAIHLGEVFGKFTKILYFFACLVATTLPVTGTIIWIHKLKKKRKRTEKKKAVESMEPVTRPQE